MNSARQAGHVDRVLDALARAGCAPRRAGAGWRARCPAHDDRNPSLTLREGRDGRVLLRCWSGCKTRRVLEALGLDWRELFCSPRGGRP